jgi:hypothetical protein
MKKKPYELEQELHVAPDWVGGDLHVDPARTGELYVDPRTSGKAPPPAEPEPPKLARKPRGEVSMLDTATLIRLSLATGATGAWRGLELALAAAQEAGKRALLANGHLPPAEQLALALQAADQALEGLAVELTGDPPAE